MYVLQVAAYNSEGKSNPSQVVEFITNPDRPSCPCRPVIRGKVLPNSFKMAWGERHTSVWLVFLWEKSESQNMTSWRSGFTSSHFSSCPRLIREWLIQSFLHLTGQTHHSSLCFDGLQLWPFSKTHPISQLKKITVIVIIFWFRY